MNLSDSPIFLLAFSIPLIVGSSSALFLESTPFIGGHSTPISRFAALETDLSMRGISINALRTDLNDCVEAINGPTGMAQPNTRRSAVLLNCQTFANDVAAAMPSFALAWYVEALTSSNLENYNAFNLSLSAAQNTAPNEQGLAELRVDLAEHNFQQLTPETRAGHDNDLRLLVQSRQGVASIANRYVAHADFRERITTVVETLNEEDQSRFVSNVRAAARALTIQRGPSL